MSLVLIACGAREGGGPGGEVESAASAAVSATDDAGHEVRLAKPATRIVSLVPAITDILVSIGARDRLVGRTRYDTAAVLRELPSVGGGLDPSIEAIVALRPDLVVGWDDDLGRMRSRLASAGIELFSVATQDTSDLFANFGRLGRLTGLTEAARDRAATMRAELADVHRSVAGVPRPSVLYVSQWEPPMTAGSRSFVIQLVGVAGGRSAFEDIAQPWPAVSLEEIVRRQPDIVIAGYGETSDDPMDRLRSTPGWRDLRAVQTGRVVLIPADLLNRPGPDVAEAARRLRDAFHPALSRTP